MLLCRCGNQTPPKMSAIVEYLLQDIRTDVLLELDPRVWTKKEATAAILLTGACACVRVCVSACVRVCSAGAHTPAVVDKVPPSLVYLLQRWRGCYWRVSYGWCSAAGSTPWCTR